MKPSRRLPLAVLAIAALVSIGALVSAVRPAGALSVQHADDVGNGYRALTRNFYRTVTPAALLAGARAGIA
jgi:hypothetical protein